MSVSIRQQINHIAQFEWDTKAVCPTHLQNLKAIKVEVLVSRTSVEKFTILGLWKVRSHLLAYTGLHLTRILLVDFLQIQSIR